MELKFTTSQDIIQVLTTLGSYPYKLKIIADPLTLTNDELELLVALNTANPRLSLSLVHIVSGYKLIIA